MMKRNVIILMLLCVLTMAVLVGPVSGAGLTIMNGDKIISQDGFTSPTITIDDTAIPADYAITINITPLHKYVADSFTFSDANVMLEGPSASNWTPVVEGDTLTLTLNEGATADVGDSVNVTFTGGIYSPWVPDTSVISGDMPVPLTVTRTDTAETATINFSIEIVPAPSPTAGLTIKNGDWIISPDGATTPVITVIGAPIRDGGNITIDISPLKEGTVFAGWTVTDANIVINSNAGATWNGTIEGDNLILTSTNGVTSAGDTIDVTFRGTPENPWVAYSYGHWPLPLTVSRDDGSDPATIMIVVDTMPSSPVGLSIANGDSITTTTGATSFEITITGQPIEKDSYITLIVPFMQYLTASYTFIGANVILDGPSASNWTPVIEGDNLKLLLNDGATADIGDSVTVTFTGAANPWRVSRQAEYPYNPAVRSDGHGTGYFTFMISTQDPTPLTIGKGAKIETPDGNTSMEITITGADIVPEGTIIVDMYTIQKYVAKGRLTNANIEISDHADHADWTRQVTGDLLILTSHGGSTIAGETVNVTFTGATNPWKGNTNDEKTEDLYPIRSDGAGWDQFSGASEFLFVINTTPPIGSTLDIDFLATPTSGIPPLLVSFTDTSNGHPTEWSWDFGDGGTSTDRNPIHIYSQPGKYDVTLTVWNKYTMGLVSKSNYINIVNGAVVKTDSEFSGLTISHCGGSQEITVNTSILTVALTSGNSVLEIQAPPESGFKTITFFTNNRNGFAKNGDLITGHPTSVHLESVEIVPTLGFSDTVGKASSFTYSIDLPSYPCNAKLIIKIWEGAIPKYDTLFRKVASENHAFPVGTAYTVEITKTNFPQKAPAKITMSVDRRWSPSISGEYVFIWRIADDEKTGQILPTRYVRTDPVTNLDYYVAESNGFSTFGISSLTGPNNPFQMIAFVAANVINPGGSGSGSGTNTENAIATNAEPGSPYSEIQGGGIVVPTPAAPTKPAPLSQPAMSTNVGMFGWLLAIIQDYPIILVGVAGAIVAVAYFGWWKRRL